MVESVANAATQAPTPTPIDRLWVLLSAFVVFFMQAGFLSFEAGCVRPNNATSVALKNVLDWLVTTVVFCFVGFGIMFGTSWNGVFGTGFVGLEGIPTSESAFGVEFVLFQLGFAGTAATIVSGAMAERTSLLTYSLAALAIALVIYPVFGHWAWGGTLLGTHTTLLSNLGFMDFAGGTVVHSLGGWVALVGTWFLGPRLGRFSNSGKPQALPSFGLAWSALGVFILWFGWWGFNGGSTLAMNGEVSWIIVRTTVAGGGAGLAAFAHAARRQQKRELSAKILGGVVGGLVAITPCCNVVTLPGALVVGVVAGVLHNISYERLAHYRIDDPVGAVPVHLVCGIWGTLAVALVGRADALVHERFVQLGVQCVGIVACGVWACGLSALLFVVLRKTVGLRVSPEQELGGISLDHTSSSAQSDDDEAELDGAELHSLMADEQ